MLTASLFDKASVLVNDLNCMGCMPMNDFLEDLFCLGVHLLLFFKLNFLGDISSFTLGTK